MVQGLGKLLKPTKQDMEASKKLGTASGGDIGVLQTGIYRRFGV